MSGYGFFLCHNVVNYGIASSPLYHRFKKHEDDILEQEQDSSEDPEQTLNGLWRCPGDAKHAEHKKEP